MQMGEYGDDHSLQKEWKEWVTIGQKLIEVKLLQDQSVLKCGPFEMVHSMRLPRGGDSVNSLDGCGLKKGKTWNARLVRMFTFERMWQWQARHQ